MVVLDVEVELLVDEEVDVEVLVEVLVLVEVVVVGRSAPFWLYPGALEMPPVLKNRALLASVDSALGGFCFKKLVDFLCTAGEKSDTIVTCSLEGLAISPIILPVRLPTTTIHSICILCSS